MKLKTIIICFLCGVFLIGVGSALTFFEVAGFEVRDGIPPYAEPELELEPPEPALQVPQGRLGLQPLQAPPEMPWLLPS